ncbi:MAG: DUF302 domain-containing protein [Candidatus Eremiobacteraeota bacterium]|nr:DUF302 domain-containing protein [Candidatus Eremiobacteraeota bacterium]
MTKTSRFSYAETLEKLKDAIITAGNTVFASIDQSAAARDAGLTLRPTTLLIFGNPKSGTPLMDAFPLVALELPLKLLIWDDGGKASLAYVPMSEIAARYGVTGVDARIDAMDRALDSLTRTVALP